MKHKINPKIVELHARHAAAQTHEERVIIESLVDAEVERERRAITNADTADVILSYLNTKQPVRILLAGLIERIHELESQLATEKLRYIDEVAAMLQRIKDLEQTIQSQELEHSENQEKS